MEAVTPDWDKLSLDQKLTELGFERSAGDSEMLDKHFPESQQKRLHAALDQLLDAGGLLVEVEAIAQPFADGEHPDEAVEALKKILALVTAED